MARGRTGTTARTASTRRGKRRPLTPEERTERRRQIRAQRTEDLDQAARALLTTEGIQAWVRFRQRLYRYSTNNMLGAWAQWRQRQEQAREQGGDLPDLSTLAPFGRWRSLGRSVRKGEKGIRIYRPYFSKLSAQRAQALRAAGPLPYWVQEDKDGDLASISWTAEYVFDASQTDGDPLPEPPEPQPLTGDSHADRIPGLVRFAEDLGYAVEFSAEDPRGASDAGGWCNPTAKRIWVRDSRSANQQVKTLTHELAHALGIDYTEYGREHAEVIVEAASAIACAQAGLESEDFSVPYMAAWGAEDDLGAVRRWAQTIDAVAERLEGALGVSDDDGAGDSTGDAATDAATAT